VVRQLAKAPWWACSVATLAVVGLVFIAVTSLSLWPRAEAQHPNPDPNGGLVVYFSASNYTVGEGDGQVVITVLLSAASSQAVTVDFATSDGTATANEDYVPISGTLTFAPGETSKTITVTIIDSSSCFIEPVEEFYLELNNPSGAGLGSPGQTTVTIVEDDGAP
jgi:hypothetical protein